MRIKTFITKQYEIGTWFGGAKRLYSGGMSYQGMWGVLVSSNVMYNSLMLRPEEYGWLISWLEYWMLLAVLAFALTFASWIHWAFEIPSSIRFGQNQAWKHHNPERDLLFQMQREINEKMDRILLEIQELKEE